MDTIQKEDSLDKATAARYLNLYVADIDWEPYINDAWKKIQNKSDAVELMRNKLACTVMLPYLDKSTIPDPPQNLLYWCNTWSQFKEREWWPLLKQAMKEDAEIDSWRNQALSLGIVYPLDYSPVTRQAFKWLWDKAVSSNAITETNKNDIQRRLQNIVLAYGGNVVCSIFLKEEHKLKKILNWRTGYFFEKIIFEVYSIDQVLKIKKAELAKTNQKLVKSVRHD